MPGPREPLLSRLRQAFLDHGYEQMTMSGLGPMVGLTRRALYHHFSNKEEAFRYVLGHDGNEAIEASLALGRDMLARHEPPLEIFVAVMDRRYGDNRRRLAHSPHALEINDKAFRLARDIMVGHATVFQDEVARLIGEMVDSGGFALRKGVTAAELAQMLCDAARGSNQTLPPIPIEALPTRYRLIVRAILYGTAEA